MSTRKQYDREYLKNNIYMLDLVDVIKTQTIDAEFAAKYLLNPKYQLNENEQNISPKMILFYQPHITKEELTNAMLNYNTDDDSIDDFLTVSNNKK